MPQDLGAGPVLDAAKGLRAGEYIWAPQVAPTGPVLFIVNLTSQRAILYRNGIPIGITTVSTGRDGYTTPTGIFTILQKHVRHFSSIYDNAPMPYMQRLTWGGIALHGGALPGYPASHGCIRLPHAFAKLLYAETTLGMTVMIVRQPTLPPLAPTVSPLGGIAELAKPPAGYHWSPERSPAGPMSVILSSTDKMVRVIRNGREIGSAPIEIAAPVTRPLVFVLQSVDRDGQHWARILPGPESQGVPLLAADIRVSDTFKRLVQAALQPGTTVIITPDTLSSRAAAMGDVLESE